MIERVKIGNVYISVEFDPTSEMTKDAIREKAIRIAHHALGNELVRIEGARYLLDNVIKCETCGNRITNIKGCTFCN